MSRTNSEYRDLIRDYLDTGNAWRLRMLRPFRVATNADEARRLGEAALSMSDEELDRLRTSPTPEQEPPTP